MADHGGFQRLAFEPAYEVEVDPEFPADGRWASPVFAYDRDGRAQSDPVSRWGVPRVIRVRPVDSPEWVGMFPCSGLGGLGGLGGVSGILATPSPGHLCVLADGEAFIVGVDAPGEGAVPLHVPVKQVASAMSPPLLLLVSDIDVVAVGAHGVAWRSPRLAVDDLRVVDVSTAGIRCTGDVFSEEEVSILVDPASGRVTSGPRLEGAPWEPGTSQLRRRWWRRRNGPLPR
jgi:hypothetical protein